MSSEHALPSAILRLGIHITTIQCRVDHLPSCYRVAMLFNPVTKRNNRLIPYAYNTFTYPHLSHHTTSSLTTPYQMHCYITLAIVCYPNHKRTYQCAVFLVAYIM